MLPLPFPGRKKSVDATRENMTVTDDTGTGTGTGTNAMRFGRIRIEFDPE